MNKLQNQTNKILSQLLSHKWLLVLLSIFTIAYLFTLFNKYIQNDEAWFGEEAYWLLKEGVVKMKTMPLSLNFHERVFMYYKLFIYFGVAIIWLFGWNLLPLKIFILLLYVVLVLLLYRFSKKQALFNQHPLLTTLLFVSTPLLIDISFMYRPEIPVVFFGFISFLFLHKSKKFNSPKQNIWSGIFAGLAFLTHPNGSAFVAAGFIFLASYKKIKPLLYYTIPAFIVSILFFFDFLDPEVAKGFISNFKNWPGKEIDPNANVFIQRLLQLLNEQQRFFWSIRVQSASVLFLLALIFAFKKLKTNIPETLRYLLILILCANILGGNFAERYLSYYLPFMAIITSVGIYHIAQTKKTWLSTIMLFAFLFHIYANYEMFNFIYNKRFNHKAEHQMLAGYISEQSRVLAPWDFIYNEIGKYEIYSYKNVEYYNYKKVSNSQFIAIVDTLMVDHVILTDRILGITQFNLDSIRTHGLNNFKPIYSDKKYIILKRSK